MKNQFIKVTGFLLFFLSVSIVNAQDDFEKKYLMGKDLISKGKYDPAMEILKPLTIEDPDNKFIRYAHYYYSLAALKGGRYQDAYNMLFQLVSRYPDWEKTDEAYYLLANVSFEQKKYRQALSHLEGRKKDLKEDSDQMKASYLRKVVVLDTLINIQRDFPEDPVIAKTLARKLSRASELNEKQRMLLEYLIQEFRLDKKEFNPARKSVMKSSYNVAVLFPFLLEELNTAPGARSNQFVYDLYQGMQLAADSLKKAGIIINLLAYDTERNEQKVAEILNMPEMKSMDLIIGPIYPQGYALVNQFGLQNQILVVNPLSENAELLEDNPFVYLFQPTLRNIAGAASRYASENFLREIKPDKKTNTKNPVMVPAVTKQVIIFQSPTSRDSLAAGYYRDSITIKGMEVKYHEVISRENMRRVQELLGDSTMLLQISHLYVSSTDQVLAANVVSAMEISGFNIPILTTADWLQFPLLTYDQYERREMHFIYPEFVDYNTKQVKDFRKIYFNTFNTLPFTNHAYEGYDMLLLFGNALGKYGNYFTEELTKQGYTSGVLLPGFNYSISRSNSFVPIVKFIDSNLSPVNLPVKIK